MSLEGLKSIEGALGLGGICAKRFASSGDGLFGHGGFGFAEDVFGLPSEPLDQADQAHAPRVRAREVADLRKSGVFGRDVGNDRLEGALRGFVVCGGRCLWARHGFELRVLAGIRKNEDEGWHSVRRRSSGGVLYSDIGLYRVFRAVRERGGVSGWG